MSTVIQLGNNFSRISTIKRLVVLYVSFCLEFDFNICSGASYCAVGYNPDLHTPSAEKPLGIEFPGAAVSWQEPGTPNWVGYLITKYLAGSEPILVYDFAVGGDVAMGVKRQVQLMNEKLLKPEPPWTADNSLFSWCSSSFQIVNGYRHLGRNKRLCTNRGPISDHENFEDACPHGCHVRVSRATLPKWSSKLFVHKCPAT